MAAITYNSKSDQVKKLDKVPVDYLNPRESGGRVRVRRVSYTTETGNLDADNADVHVELARLPAGAEIVGGFVSWEALTGATTGTANLGITPVSSPDDADDNVLASALDVTAAGSAQLPEAGTVAGITKDKEFSVFAQLTTDDADLTVDKDIYGYILYVENS